MASSALAKALKDFGARPLESAGVFTPAPSFAVPDTGLPTLPDFPTFDPVDTDALVADAVAAAAADLTERLEQQHAEALETQRAQHAEEIAALQHRFAEEASGLILKNIESMETRVVELTTAVTARILGVVLTDDVRERSIERLASVIRDALDDDEAVRIRVRGSLPLYEALKEKLPKYADQLDFTETVDFDISVAIDDSVFETRLAEWSTALSEALS
jgi:hypothetical protein